MYIITSGKKAHIAVKDIGNLYGWRTACGIPYIDYYRLRETPCREVAGKPMAICKDCQRYKEETK